jgi:23S rRNA (cytidine1920-2'-O)/16S rRNA (cytidine1409-2'-O)-methyltransferase
MTKQRLDKLVVERGLAESRARAQSMIMAGQVLVANQLVDKPGHAVDTSCDIRIKGNAPRYVSRGGLKLEAALRGFDLSVNDRMCIDIGASTGGFTDCLLQHGARRVWAVDVGHNQLVWKLRQDPRVVVREGVNARNLASSSFPEPFDVATIDVSFISLAKILPAVRSVIVDSADCIALIKPQFEVGKGEVGRGGIVTDPAKHRRVLAETTVAARTAGFAAVGLIESPILGAEGNREFLLHLKPATEELNAQSAELDGMINALTPLPD